MSKSVDALRASRDGRSAGEMSMLPASMEEDLEGGAKEAMAKMEGRKVRLL